MSKRDIILFDIGRKTTGFSEKNLRESSEPSPLSRLYSIPSSLYPSVRRENKPVIFSLVYSEDTPAASPATGPVIELALSSAARSSGYYLENPYIRVSLYENDSHLGGYITGFDSNVKGFFASFCPLFLGIFLDISC